MDRRLAPALLMLLAGCVGPPSPPVVDMNGVDPAKYQQDLADCRAAKKWTLTFGNDVDECLQAKGYKILVE
jgi:hypothetical protein